MNFEVIYYTLVSTFFFIGFFADFRVKNLSLFLFFMMPIVVRMSGFDVDIQNYLNYFKQDFSSYAYNFRYIKEPVFWFSMYGLNHLISNPLLLFLLVDYIVLLIIYRAFREFEIPEIFLLGFVVFFPFFLGFQNIYRQMIGGVFIFIALNQKQNSYRVFFFWVISFLVHNIYFLFLPIVLFVYGTKLARIFAVISLVCALFSLSFVTYSQHVNTGLSLEYLYLIVFVVLDVFFYLYRKKDKAESWKLLSIFLILYVVFLLNFDSLYVERFALAGLMAFYISSVRLLVRIRGRPRYYISFFFSVFFCLPIFLFSSSRAFIS